MALGDRGRALRDRRGALRDRRGTQGQPVFHIGQSAAGR